VYQINGADIFGQMEGLFDGGISAADGNDNFVLKEGGVTCAAITYAGAGLTKFFFAGDAEFAIGAAGGQDNHPGQVCVPVGADFDEAVRAALEMEGFLAAFDFGAEGLDLLYHLQNQVRPGDVNIARVVFDPVGSEDLSARVKLFEDDGLEAVTSGIECSAQSGRTGSDDEAVC